MAILPIGSGITPAAIADGELTNIDGSLIDIHGDYIIDNLGNTISIGGGVAEGDSVVGATLTPSNEATAIFTGADNPTAVTWE